MLLGSIICILTVVICYVFFGHYWWFPASISEHGKAYDAQFTATLWVTGIIFFLAQVALGYAIIKFRDRGGTARYSHGNNVLEVTWTAATALLFIGLVLAGTRIWAAVHFEEAPANAERIEVMAKQFAWSFRYPGPDGKFGRTDIKLVNDANGNPLPCDPMGGMHAVIGLLAGLEVRDRTGSGRLVEVPLVDGALNTGERKVRAMLAKFGGDTFRQGLAGLLDVLTRLGTRPEKIFQESDGIVEGTGSFGRLWL